MMTPSEVGTRTELAVAAALASAGKEIMMPLGPRRYDLAYEEDGSVVKVQCKSGREYNGVLVFRTSTEIHGTYRDYRNEIDLFGVYCHSRREVYLVPVDAVPRRLAHLRLIAPRNNQQVGIRMAAQYLVEDGRLPDAVIHRFSTPANNRGRTRGSTPSRFTSSLNRQMSMFECTLASTNVDIGESMAIPIQLAPDQMPVACCSPLAASRLDDTAATATATLFKALGDPNRVRVVNLLANEDKPVCVCDITAYLGLSQSTVSFHLKKLVNAGLVKREQHGTWAYYSLDPDAMSTLRSVVESKGASV